MVRRRTMGVVEQLELLGLDELRLSRAAAPFGATPGELHARWQGPRLPCTGEAQLRCGRCGLEAAVRFRCAGSCEHACEHGERAAATILRVIPRVPVRHWVLTLPGALRPSSAVDQRFVAELCRHFLAEVFEFVRARVGARAQGPTQCGGVSLVHRAARALVLDVHVHALVLDGAYVADGRGPPLFVPMDEGPGPDEVLALTRRLRERLLARWRRRRRVGVDDELWRLAIEQSIAAGPVAATAVRRIRIDGVGVQRSRRVGVGARRDGFGVHVMERIEGHARGALGQLARYLVRAPVALAELRTGPGERVVQRLPHAFADGSTHVEFSADELARRLIALSPPRQVHRVSYHGALAPGAAAKWRARPVQLALVDPAAVAVARPRRSRRRERTPWPEPECARCGGQLRVVALDERTDPAPFGHGGAVAPPGDTDLAG